MRRSMAVPALVLALCTAGTAQAQVGELTGRVTSADGAFLPGATVTVTSLAGGKSLTANTDNEGRYWIQGLRQGAFRVRAELEGFRSAERASVTVVANPRLPTEVDFTLTVGDTAPERVELKVVDVFTNAPIQGASISATLEGRPARQDGSAQSVQDCLKLPASVLSFLGLRPAEDVATDESGRGWFSTCAPRMGHTYALKGRLAVSKSEYSKWDKPLHRHTDWLHADDGFYTRIGLVPLVTPSESGGETFSIRIDAGSGSIDFFEPTKITDTRRTFFGGTAVDDTSSDLAPDAFRSLFSNKGEQRELGLGAQWNLRLFGDGTSRSMAASAPGGSDSGRRSVPRALTSLRAWVGQSEVELEYDKIDDQSPGGRDTLWTGRGTAFRLGIAEFVNLGRRPGLYLKLDYEYERMLESDVTRSPGIAAPGGRVLRDEGRYQQHAHEARAVLGWSTRHVSPWAGVRVSRSSVRLTGEAAAEYQIPQGVLEQRISFVNEFEANRVLAAFGLDVRIPRTRLHLRAEGATDGSDLHLGLSVSYGWGLGR